MHDRPFPFARGRATIAAVTEAAFAIAVARHRAELRRHCARIVGPADAEDAVQETFLRAWRAQHTRPWSPRSWLYRIATNVCCDVLTKRRDHVMLDDDVAAAPGEQQPEAVLIAKETVELALLAALRHLPARQHASLVMRDVLRCSAGETAAAMSVSVAASNSALQRARTALRAHLGQQRLDWAAERPTAVERHLIEGLACL
jgi:RNA polymerase sigma factor (sigma-70 family)